VLCKYFGKCGGCSLMDLDYEEQLKLKQNKVEFLFGRIDKVIPSPKPIYYRNRMDYVIGEKEGKVIVGLKEKGKWWKIIDLEECFLMSKEADKIKNLFKEFVNKKRLKAWDLKKHKGLLRYLVIREGKFTKERMVVVNTSNDYLNQGFKSNKKIELSEKDIKAKEDFQTLLLEFYELLRENGLEINSFIHGVNNTITDISTSFEINVLKGEELIKEELNNYKFLIGPNSFFQSNSYTAELMIKEVESFIKGSGEKEGFNNLIDLFCGEGTFSIPFNKYFEKIIGVELNKESIELYKKNLELNGLNKQKYELINKAVEKIDFEIGEKDLIIVDPPRSGLNKKTIKWLRKQKNKYFIYISCNPETQYRDLALLKEFKLSKLITVDQFPQTNHVETIAFLERNNL
jgi:tRNA (uracil-5-)-methyltransferase